MKNLKYLVTLVLFYNSFLYASTVDIAYKEFFNNEIISTRHCGQNIYHFLNFLEKKKIKYKTGYVVSVHEDFGSLNLYNARWGSEESYADGENYFRSNYYFHVFAIIDGKAYDFSKNYTEKQDAYDYIKEAYLPKKETQNIFFQGVKTPEKVRDEFHFLKMSIYTLDGYKKNYGENIYQGAFIELFKYYENEPSSNREGAVGDYSISYTDRVYNKKFDAMTYTYPMANHKGKNLNLIAEGTKACRALGYLGAVPMLTKHEVSDKKAFYDLYTSLSPKESSLTSNSLRVSFKEKESVGSVSNQPLLHYAKSVTCTRLESVLNSILK